MCFVIKGCDDACVAVLAALLAEASVAGPTSLEIGVDVAVPLGTALTLRRPTSGICVVRLVCGYGRSFLG